MADWYDEKYYASAPSKNSPGSSSGHFRVLRGGSWYQNQDYARAASRDYNAPSYHNLDTGFRCVGVGPGK